MNCSILFFSAQATLMRYFWITREYLHRQGSPTLVLAWNEYIDELAITCGCGLKNDPLELSNLNLNP